MLPHRAQTYQVETVRSATLGPRSDHMQIYIGADQRDPI